MNAITGGTPPKTYEYETLAGDVCKRCGCVVGDEAIHARYPHPALKPAKEEDQ